MSVQEGSLDQSVSASLAQGEVCGWRRPRLGWITPLALATLALCLNLAGNAGTGLWDRDEPRYAVAVREMRARGDWVFPSFNGEPRYHKPILIYWLMGLSTGLAGDSPFAARLVSAIAGAGTCLLVWGMGRRMLGPRGGLLACLMLAVSPIMVAESKLATTDATLTLFLVGAQFCLFELSRRPSRALAALFWTALGLACLTKGPVGPVLLAASAGLAWFWGHPVPLVWKQLYPRWGLAALAAATLPWYLAIAIASKGEFLRFAVGDQIGRRVSTGMEAHGGFPGYYLAVTALAFYPWASFVPAALLGAWQRRRTSPVLAFLLGWMVGPWLFLECLPTRMLHYLLPAYPASALLIAWMVESIVNEEVSLRRWPLGRLGLGLLGGIGIGGTVGLLAAAIALPSPLRLPLVLLAVLAAGGTLFGMLRLHQGLTLPAVLGLGLAWSVFLLVAGGWLIPAAEPYRTSRRVGQRLAVLAAQTGARPVLLNYKEPGVIYAMGRPVATVRDQDEFYHLLDRTDSLLTVITPQEHRDFADRYALGVTPLESLEGFSLTKGAKHMLEFAILRRPAPPRGRSESVARAGSLEQSLVK
jgi:4-amino-4-deoxy-L-arabinose transferase-like glycosyltransferase